MLRGRVEVMARSSVVLEFDQLHRTHAMSCYGTDLTEDHSFE
jgi:hypothetical protein